MTHQAWLFTYKFTKIGLWKSQLINWQINDQKSMSLFLHLQFLQSQSFFQQNIKEDKNEILNWFLDHSTFEVQYKLMKKCRFIQKLKERGKNFTIFTKHWLTFCIKRRIYFNTLLIYCYVYFLNFTLVRLHKAREHLGQPEPSF